MRKISLDKINEIIKNSLPYIESILNQWFPDGKIKGNEYLAKNAKRGDKKEGSFSINLTTGQWSDFAESGSSGHDLVHLHHWYFGTSSMSESARVVATMINDPDFIKEKPVRRKKQSDWENCTLNPPRDPNKEDFKNFYDKDSKDNWLTRDPVDVFPFLNEDETIAGYACRFEYINEKGEVCKDVQYLTWCRNLETGEERWKYRHFKEPRPLMDRHLLEQNKKAFVIITEGEKCNRFVNTHLFGKMVGTTWPGGTNAIDKTDFGPVIGRKKVIWPDNDKVGFEAALKIANKEPAKENVKFFLPPMGKPKGWDIADAGEEMELEALKNMLRDGLVSYAEFSAIDIDARFSEKQKNEFEFEDPDFEDFEYLEQGFYGEDESEIIENPVLGNYDSKWRPLGYDHEIYYYYSYTTGQLIALKAGQHDESNLLRFADLGWWETYWQGSRKPNYTAAKNFMMEACHRVGVFDDQMIRGCGCWLDDGRVVIHRGDHLMVDGSEIPVEKYKGRYIYEKDIKVDVAHSAPLTNKDSIKLLDITKKLNWQQPISAYYLAGWCVCSIIGGVLPWRPHIFITGPAGSGKSWVMNRIIAPILGREKTNIQGDTSAAGLRALSGNRSWPWLGDEIEAKNEQQQKRLTELLMLCRCASTDGEAGIVKSTSDGKARVFMPRSCTAFSAIGMNLEDNADITRFTVLNLAKPKVFGDQARQNFIEFENLVSETLTQDYCAALRSRIQKNAIVIRKNHKVFARAASAKLGARLGDQIGALLAGAHALVSSAEIDLEFAKSWIASQDWSDYGNLDTDEDVCMSYIMDSQIQFEKPNSGGSLKRTIAEIFMAANPLNNPSDEDEEYISPKYALNVLKRYGISRRDDKPNGPHMILSVSHRELKSLLKGTPWTMNWGNTLGRISGAEHIKAYRFAGDSVSRAVVVPMPKEEDEI